MTQPIKRARKRETVSEGRWANICPKCNLGGLSEQEFKRHRCTSLARLTAAERDERIVAKAIENCGKWSYKYPLFCQQWENYNLMEKGVTRDEVFQAACRILNRLASKRRAGR